MPLFLSSLFLSSFSLRLLSFPLLFFLCSLPAGPGAADLFHYLNFFGCCCCFFPLLLPSFAGSIFLCCFFFSICFFTSKPFKSIIFLCYKCVCVYIERLWRLTSKRFSHHLAQSHRGALSPLALITPNYKTFRSIKI